MRRHRFDPISFFFGLVFTALAVWVLFADDLDIFSVRWLWPLVLIVGGVALLVSLFGGSGPLSDGAEAGDELPADVLAEAAAELPDEPYLR
jgi:hypothetical protein